MSSYFGALNSTYKLDTLFKKYLGYANTNVGIRSEYGHDATPRVLAKYVQTQTVPDVAPIVDTSGSLSSGQVYWMKSTLSYIKKYENVPLIAHSGKNSTYVCGINDTNGVSLLKNIIPGNYGKGGYEITVTTYSNIIIGADSYILDRDAGIISFYDYNFVSAANPPKITFWRYEGSYGFDNLASNFSIGDVSEGAVGSLPVVTFSDTVGGGKAFNFTLPAPYSGVDGIDGSDAKQVILSGVEVTYTTNPADVSGYFVAGTETATEKPYTLHLVVKAGADGQDGADGAVGAPGSDVVYAILNYTYTFNPAPSITNGVGTEYSIAVPKGLSYSAGQDIVICSKETPESATPNKLYADVLSYTENVNDASLNFIVKDITSTSSGGWTVQKQYDINVNEIPTAVGGWQSGNNAQTQTFNLRDIGIGVSSPEAALDVSGAVKFRDALTVASDISGAGALRIAGAADLKSTLSVVGDISGDGALRIGGVVDLKSTLTVADDISGAGDLYVGGNIYLGGTFKDSAGNSIQLADGFNATYNDAYFNTNLTSKPPAPVLKNTLQTSTEIGFSFTNPTQIPFGDIWVPYIKSIIIEISGVSTILDLCESFVPKTANEVSAFVLTNVSSVAAGRYAKTIGGISEQAYVKYVASYIDGSIIKIGYSNNAGGTISYLTVPLATFLEAYPPVAPGGGTFTVPGGSLTATLTWTTPLATRLADGITGTTIAGINVDGYTVDISETGIIAGTKRFGTTATAYNKAKNTQTLGAVTTTTYTTTPKTSYTINVSAKNNKNTSYGAILTYNGSNNSYPTEPVDGPTNDLTYTGENYTTTTIRAVGATSDVAGSSPVYRVGGLYTHSFTPSNTLNGIKIHNGTTVGDTTNRTVTFTSTRAGTNLFTEVMSVSGDFINDGSYVNTSLSKVKIASLQKSDAYTGDLSGYYQTFSMKPVLDLSNNAATFPASSGEYAFGIGFGNSADNTDKTYRFYLEDFDTTVRPSITCDTPVLTINNKKKVSGIEIADSSDTITKVTFNNIDVSGIGKYFYNSSLIYEIKSDAPYYFPITSQKNILPTGTTAPLSTFRYSSHVVNIQSNTLSGVTDNIIFKLDALNINGNNVQTQPSFIVPIRFDKNTYTFNYSSSIISAVSTGSNTSVYRVEHRAPSEGLLSSSPYYTTYDNTQLIVGNATASYNSSIPMWDGLFRYENTAFYSGLESETGFRYITFAWDGPKSGSVAGKLKFILNNFATESATNNLSYNSTTSHVDSSTNNDDTYRVYYRFEHVNADGSVKQPDVNATDLNPNFSSYWLDATSAYLGSGPINVGKYASQIGSTGFANTSNNKSGALVLQDGETVNFANSGGVVTHYVFAPSTTYSSSSYVRIYLTIGIKANTHRFGRVDCVYA
jgi:hypothetical protein